ncbi:hypothetical protein H072_1771 [Dactylellina haptotyla CBS 200.50]|uniref:HTH APSES-type domain-containing protein n=1 Tax=Dactylellina haptotyla (strain CBS 200.50) TaxID=1284197 RepID=S8BXJ9_DACHA|nr:hypothetical protein H072_1771 [Dactylellina haptotyla CBS 200.50]
MSASSKLPLPVPGHSSQPAPGSVSAYSTTQPSGSHYSAHPVSSTGLASTQPYYSHDTSVTPQYIGMDSYSHQSYSQPQSANSGHTPTSAGAMPYSSSHMPPPYEPQHTTQSAYPQFSYPTTSMPSTLSSSVSSTQGPFRGVMTPGGAGSLVSSRGESNMLDTYNKAIYPSTPDTTGQVCPPGAKPRVTATLWEDEGSLCFQVEAKGVCVARREDNHMINGTKLLNVAGMTRGRRDGILKSEKVRHVVKIGPMHLKGVWIPFQRALDFANKEKITELLYPLFVHNIGALLYHPTNSTRTSAVIHAARREGNPWTAVPPQLPASLPTQGGGPGSGGQQSGAPNAPTPQRRSTDSLISPASVSSTATSMAGQTSASLVPSHPLQTHRPSIERSITFPTPPSSASSLMMPNGDSQFWSSSNLVSANQPLAIDTAAMASSRSMPATPATTPPGGGQLQSYSSSSTGGYSDPYRNVNSQSSMGRYPSVSQQSQYLTNGRAATDMGPPQSARAGPNTGSSRPSSSQNDGRISNLGESSSLSHDGGNSAEHGEEEADHEEEYTHDNNLQSYNTSRGSYYPSSTILPSDQSAHHSPEINGGAPISGTDVPRSTYDASSVAVPRTVDTSSARTGPDGTNHWNSGSTYTTSPHLARYDSYNSNGDRSSETHSTNSSYQVQSGIVPMSNSYGDQTSGMPSSLAGTKRGREDDDGPSRPSSRAGDSTDPDGLGIKRRRTGMPSPASSFNGTSTIPRRTAIPTGVQQRRR